MRAANWHVRTLCCRIACKRVRWVSLDHTEDLQQLHHVPIGEKRLCRRRNGKVLERSHACPLLAAYVPF
jgi:hypothetical protein